MTDVRHRKTVVDFIEDVIAYRIRQKGTASDARLAKEVGVSAATFSRWRAEKTSITIENLEMLVFKLTGAHLGQCLYLPGEVSTLRAIEVDTLNRLDREVKKPGRAAGTG